jgi:hypothetical protein
MIKNQILITACLKPGGFPKMQLAFQPKNVISVIEERIQRRKLRKLFLQI